MKRRDPRPPCQTAKCGKPATVTFNGTARCCACWLRLVNTKAKDTPRAAEAVAGRLIAEVL